MLSALKQDDENPCPPLSIAYVKSCSRNRSLESFKKTDLMSRDCRAVGLVGVVCSQMKYSDCGHLAFLAVGNDDLHVCVILKLQNI